MLENVSRRDAPSTPRSVASIDSDLRAHLTEAERENEWLSNGTGSPDPHACWSANAACTVHHHVTHLRVHQTFQRSDAYVRLPHAARDLFLTHLEAHAALAIRRPSIPRSRPAATTWSEPIVEQRHETWLRFKRNRLALVGLALVAFEILVAVIGPWVAPYSPIAQDGAIRLQGPSAQHWFGTDDLGRDIFSRILHGAALSLGSGVGVVLLGLVVGVPLGAIAAYYRRADAIIMRASEVLLSLTGLLLALALVAIMGPGLTSVLLGAGIAGMPSTVLLTRSLVLAIRNNDYVVAACSVGCQDVRILALHILPNCLSSLTVAQTFRVAAGILTVSSLSFLGLGAQPPAPEWGAMLSNGRDFLYRAPHVATFPGLALAITVLAFNLLGDGLRDVLDPRFTGSRRP